MVVSYSCVIRPSGCACNSKKKSPWAFFPPEIFLFWQVVTFQNIEIIFDVIQCCELRFQFFECGMDFQNHYIF